MISVIVPVYKVEPYLHQCVDSILAQTFTDFELILVDDGSPDNCGRICDEYAKQDDRVRVIHQENGGLSAARNAGIDAAKGEYITFIDSDDVVTYNYIEVLYENMLNNNADVTVCSIHEFTDDSEIETCFNVKNILKLTGKEACLSIYRHSGYLWVSAYAKLYRKALFNGIYFPVGYIHEDQATIPKVLYGADNVVIIDCIAYWYRLRQGSIMRDGFDVRQFHAIEAVNNCKAFFIEKKDQDMVDAIIPFQKIMQAKYVILAYHYKAVDQIPKQYRMCLWQALRLLRSETQDNTYSWYLSLVYPKLVKPHSYIRKIKSIIDLKKQDRKK